MQYITGFDSLRAGQSGDRIPVGGEIFGTCPDRFQGPPSLVYNGYRLFPGSKAAGAWRWPPTPSSAEVNELVELYLYSHYGSSWPLIGWTLLYFNLFYFTSFYFTSLHFTLLHFTLLYLTLLHCTLLHFSLFYFTLLYFTSLYFTLLYFTLIYFTSLHFTLLHFTSLYFILRYFT